MKIRISRSTSRPRRHLGALRVRLPPLQPRLGDPARRPPADQRQPRRFPRVALCRVRRRAVRGINVRRSNRRVERLLSRSTAALSRAARRGRWLRRSRCRLRPVAVRRRRAHPSRRLDSHQISHPADRCRHRSVRRRGRAIRCKVSAVPCRREAHRRRSSPYPPTARISDRCRVRRHLVAAQPPFDPLKDPRRSSSSSGRSSRCAPPVHSPVPHQAQAIGAGQRRCRRVASVHPRRRHAIDRRVRPVRGPKPRIVIAASGSSAMIVQFALQHPGPKRLSPPLQAIARKRRSTRRRLTRSLIAARASPTWALLQKSSAA